VSSREFVFTTVVARVLLADAHRCPATNREGEATLRTTARGAGDVGCRGGWAQSA